MIRIIKLIEIFQYTLLSFIIAFFVSILIDKYIFKNRIITKIDGDKIKVKNITYILIYLFILSTSYYYIIKYVTKIPFILSPFVDYFGYIPSLKNENKRGAALGTGFIFFREQNNFAKLIEKLFNFF